MLTPIIVYFEFFTTPRREPQIRFSMTQFFTQSLQCYLSCMDIR
jgi:hypothetical protein